ncbi:hypothetical protein ACP4OV_010367 [Aristida adscensionis]
MAGVLCALLEPRLHWFLVEVLFVLVLYGLVLEARRTNRQLRARGQHPPLSATRSDHWIKRKFVRVPGAVWSAIRQPFIRLPPAAITPEALPRTQSTTEQRLQYHQSSIEEELKSQLEIDYQPSASEDGPEVVIPEESFTPINIWNGNSLNQGLRNMMDCFKRRNHLIQVAAAYSPSSSNSSSPRHYDYTLGVTSVNNENNDRHYEFETLFLLDHGDVDIIDLSSLSQLDDMIHQFQIVQPGYEQILYKVFEDNSDVLDGFLFNYFNSASLSIAKWTCMVGSQFTCQLAKSCVMDLKVAAGLLCSMENELAEADCISFHQNLKGCYFKLCARRPIENLIGAADSISNLKWSAYHGYQMLVLYEAIVDVLRAFGYPIESDRIFQQMRVNFEGIFDGIKHVIFDILNDSQFAVTCARHPTTDFLVQSMQLLESHNKVVQHICAGKGSSSLGHLLSEVISYWAAEIKRHSMSYTKGTNYIFLLNSLSQFQLETKNALQVLLPNSEPNSKRGEISNLLESLIGEYTSKYLDECWGPLRDCVKLCGRKPHWSSLDKFTPQFNVICNCQKRWQLEPEIKTNLRKQIREYIAPSYDNFLKRLGKNPLLHARLFCQKHMAGEQAKHKTTKELEFTVEQLFECVHIE